MSNERDSIGSFLAGLILGSLVGGAVAVVLAPRSGEEVRAELRSRRYPWQTDDAASDLLDEATLADAMNGLVNGTAAATNGTYKAAALNNIVLKTDDEADAPS